MYEGTLVLRGKVVKPPYVVRQEANKIFINEAIVYPFPETEKPGKRPFKAEPELEFRVPQKVQETLEDFHQSWASGLTRDEKGLVKRTAGFERDKDFIRDAEGVVMDADAFIQDYESKKQALKEVLKSEGIPSIETERYHDILIPLEKEWGVFALFNEAERMRVNAEIDKKCPVPYKYPYEDAAKFKQYIKAGLKEGDMIVMDDGLIEFIPHQLVEGAKKEISGFDALKTDEKAETLRDFLLDPAERIHEEMKSAVIFFPHMSWQKTFTGRHARYPFSLASTLERRGYRVWIILDANVTLETWSQFLAQGQRLNLKAIYNQGHGNKNVISVGTRAPGGGNYYFNDQFVYRYARLSKTVVYAYTCLTLGDDRLATAFLSKGACTYGGWKTVAPSNPNHSDKRDGIFWRTLINYRATGRACRALNEFDSYFECRGNNRCKLP